MKKILFLILSLAVLAPMKLMAAKENKFYNITVNGKERKYLLYVPNNVKENAPLVFSLHGAGGVVTTSSHDPNFNSIADKDGFIVVYPQGLDTQFPGLGGMTAPGWSAYGENNFDTRFLLAVIDDVAEKYTIDRQRIYCCGFSNGGMMTYTMANTNSHIFAAFAAISGYPINEFHLHHTSWRPVPLLHIHGKNDDFVKYALVPNVIENMVARNGANPVPVKTTVNGNYTKSVYEAGEGGFPIIFYEIDGMGHEPFTNKTEKNSSTQTMWDFFQQYTLDSPCDTTMKWRPRIETESYEPKNHGWTVNARNTLLKFGGDQNTDENQNVYRSLQFKSGSYELRFQSEGDAALTIRVRIQKLKGRNDLVLETTVQAGCAVVLPFEISDSWGEYSISFIRSSKKDEITVSNIGIYTRNGEVTGIDDVELKSASQESGISNPFQRAWYTLDGRMLNAKPTKKGVYMREGRKVVVK